VLRCFPVALGVGDLIDGKYQIVRIIGEGGMGVVYEGLNTRIHRRVAIKLLHASLATSGDVVARFEKEAQAAGRIGSKHIVEVLDLGHFDNGDRYIVMEYLEGESLGQRLQARTTLGADELIPLVDQLLEGLGAAHGAGIVHRDLKPDNVYLQRHPRGEFVKLLDFGISKFSQLGGSEFSMTRTGSVMGSPYYMSPEQAKGSKQADHRVDLYAVGVILYEALSGKVPFDADTFNELLFKIALEEPTPIEHLVPGLDPAIVKLVHKAMAREPSHRFQSADEFRQALGTQPNSARGKTTVQLGPSAPVPSAQPRSNRPPAFAGTSPGAWSQSSSEELAPPKKRPYALVAAASIFLAGGATAMLVKLQSAAGDAEAKVTASSAAPVATAETAPPAVQGDPTKPADTTAVPSASASPITVTPSLQAAPPRAGISRPRTVTQPAHPTTTPTQPSEPAGTKGRKVRRDL
jgi:eukaryotic-like serine/threonine-protein kinase